MTTAIPSEGVIVFLRPLGRAGVVSMPRGRAGTEKFPLLPGLLAVLDIKFLLPGGRPLRFGSDVGASSVDALEPDLADPGV